MQDVLGKIASGDLSFFKATDEQIETYVNDCTEGLFKKPKTLLVKNCELVNYGGFYFYISTHVNISEISEDLSDLTLSIHFHLDSDSKEFLKIDIVSIEEESVIEAFWSSSSGTYFSKLDDYSSVSETASVALLQRKIEISVMEAIVKNAANISKGIKHSILELANYYRQNVRYR